jgi:hypothetical protein
MLFSWGEHIDAFAWAKCLGYWIVAMLLVVAVATESFGQSRVAIPSPIEGGASTSFAPNSNAGPTTFSPPVTSTPGFQTIPPTYQAPYVGGAYSPAQYTNPAPAAGAYSPPLSAYNQTPAVGGGAAFQGTVTPAPTWDPYSSADGSPLGSAPAAMPYNPTPYNPTPYTPSAAQPYQTPPYLFPGGFGSPAAAPYGQAPNCNPQQPYQRLFREIRLEDTYLTGESSSPGDLNWNMAEVSATAVFPFFYQQAPLLLTPGFAVNSIATMGQGGVNDAALPANLYGAYLDTAWKPQITNFLSADLGVRVGVYSDFDHVSSDSIRIMGRGLLVMALTPKMQLAGGVVYFDRLKTQILPAGGVIWVPNEDVRFEILFPRPKLSKRLTTLGTTQVWGYLGGEYGGGSWTVQLDNGMGFAASDRIDLNDIRITAGLEWRCYTGTRVWFETGYVFNREIIYKTNSQLNFNPDNTFMIRGGVAF